MNKMFCGLNILFCFIMTVSADNSTNLGGFVKDGDDNIIAEAIVCLSSDTTHTVITDEKGEFLLNVPSSTNTKRINSHLIGQNISISLNNKQIRFFTFSAIKEGSISLFSINGKKHFTFSFTELQTGLHTFSIPSLPTGCFFLIFNTENATISEKILFNGKYHFITTPVRTNEVISFESGKTSTIKIVDTLLIAKSGFKPEKYPISSYDQIDLIIIMDRTKSPSIKVSDLPIINEMPDPLTMKDGTKVTTQEQWRARRREMIRILEDFEYGHMPPPPDNVKATITTASTQITVSSTLKADYRKLHLTFGPDEKCGFDMGIFTPESSGTTISRYPVLISLGFSAGQSSLGASSVALSRGYAVATIPYNQLGADATNYKSTAFFPSYPDYDWRDFSAWAWGISRAVDYLVTDSLIDKDKIMTTGTSRLGQAVLLAGAFDERIALSAPVAGGMAFRYSGKEMGGGLGQGITEIVDQNTYWFGPLLENFRNQTTRLPCDQHWLPALTAPRLFIMCNSLKDEYGRAYAAVQTYLGAKPVYEFLNVEENLGFNFRDGSHGMTSEDWSALLDFADQKLLNKPGDRSFNTIPPASQTP